MPSGVNNPIIGYFGFCAVKLAGYSLAARLLSESYRQTDRSPLLIGGVRTLIGMAAGAAYYGILRLVSKSTSEVFLAGLIPIRIAEWWLLIWLFYDRQFQQCPKEWRFVFIATVWSYILDLPALVGFFVTGGAWVC